MRLRARLALATLAVALPLLAGMAWLDGYTVRRAATAAMIDEARRTVASTQETCAADPAGFSARSQRMPPPPPAVGFGRPPPPPDDPRGPPHEGRGPHGPPPMRLFPFDERLEPTSPGPRPLDPALREGLANGEAYATRVTGDRLEVLVRAAASGPCAYVLAEGLLPRGIGSGHGPPLGALAVPALLAIAAMLVAVGPTVARIRKLTSEVREGVVPTGAGADEVGDLARAFGEARLTILRQLEEQQRREKTLRDFLENTTHDVLTPLTVLQGHLAELQRKLAAGEPLDGTTVGLAAQEAHYIGALVRNLEIAAKLDAGEPQVAKEPVELNAIVARIVARHTPVARQRSVELASAVPDPPPVVVTGDVTLLEQALSNLVENAVRYNRPGGHVAVLLERSGESFAVTVADDGPGVPDEELAKISQRYARGDTARTRAPQGKGLGLDICHRVAKLHGFEVKLGRPEGGGFEVRMSGRVANA